MNLQALFDGLLAVTAFYVAKQTAPTGVALRLSACLLGVAATLGALRFSGLLPLPQLHQFFSMLGAGVGLPLLAISMTQSTSAVATQRRFAWIFLVIAAVFCTLVVIVAQLKIWTSICAIIAALAILIRGTLHKQWLTAVTGLILLSTLAAFAAKLQLNALQPSDLLHIGLTLTLILASLKITLPQEQ